MLVQSVGRKKAASFILKNAVDPNEDKKKKLKLKTQRLKTNPGNAFSGGVSFDKYVCTHRRRTDGTRGTEL